MKICPACQTPLADDARFCTACGHPVAQTPPPPPGPAPGAWPMPPQPPVDPQKAAKTLETVKAMGRSPLYLAAVILLSLNCLGSLAAQLFLPGEVLAQLQRMIPMVTVDVDLGSFTGGMWLSTLFSAILGMAPELLILVGLWMVFAAARDRQTPGMKTGGLTLLKGMSIFRLVVCALALFFGILLPVILLVVIGQIPDRELPVKGMILIAMIVVLLGCLVVFGLGLWFSVCVLRTVSTVRETVRTGLPSDRVSVFVPVWLFLSAAGTLLGFLLDAVLAQAVQTLLLPMLAEALGGFPGGLQLGISELFSRNVWGVLLQLLSAAANVLFGVLALQYRSRMRQLVQE